MKSQNEFIKNNPFQSQFPPFILFFFTKFFYFPTTDVSFIWVKYVPDSSDRSTLGTLSSSEEETVMTHERRIVTHSLVLSPLDSLLTLFLRVYTSTVVVTMKRDILSYFTPHTHTQTHKHLNVIWSYTNCDRHTQVNRPLVKMSVK